MNMTPFLIPKEQEIKGKFDKWHFIKLRNFCRAKEKSNAEKSHRMGETIYKLYIYPE